MSWLAAFHVLCSWDGNVEEKSQSWHEATKRLNRRESSFPGSLKAAWIAWCLLPIPETVHLKTSTIKVEVLCGTIWHLFFPKHVTAAVQLKQTCAMKTTSQPWNWTCIFQQTFGTYQYQICKIALQLLQIPVEIFVTKSEASGPLQNGFWLPFCAKFWPWVLPSCKWTPPWYRNFALEVRVCYPPVPTILSESGGLINNHYKLDGFKA